MERRSRRIKGDSQMMNIHLHLLSIQNLLLHIQQPLNHHNLNLNHTILASSTIINSLILRTDTLKLLHKQRKEMKLHQLNILMIKNKNKNHMKTIMIMMNIMI